EILHADVMDVEVVAGSHGSDTVENILGPRRTRHRVHHHVSIWQHFMHRIGNCGRHLLRALEGDIARHTNGKIGEVTVTRAPDAYSVNLEQAIHTRNRGENLAADTGRSS